jgi:dephospho-CoA kinase
VFQQPEELDWLEQTLFPRVGERIAAWRARLEHAERPPEMAVVEVPLLFEAGIEGAFDATIAVITDEALRAERAGGRDHRAVEGRDARQLTQEEKAARADFVVRNDGSRAELEQGMAAVMDKLRRGRSGT